MKKCDAKRKRNGSRIRKSTPDRLKKAFRAWWQVWHRMNAEREAGIVSDAAAGVREFRELLQRGVDTIHGLVLPERDVTIRLVSCSLEELNPAPITFDLGLAASVH